MRLRRTDEVDRRQGRMVAPLLDVGDDDLEAFVDDPVDAVVDDEEPQVEVGGVGQRAAEEAPAAVAREDEGVEAGVGHLCPNTEAETAAHARPVMGGVKRNPGMGSLCDVLPILVGDADVVEPDAVRPPRLVQLLIKADEVDATVAQVTRDLAGIEALGHIDRWPPPDATLRQLRNDLSENGVQVPVHDVVVATNTMAELAGDVAVLLRPAGEVPDLSGGNRCQVEGIFARIEAERDDAVVGTDAPPELHRLVVAAERDVAEAVAVVGGDGIGPVDGPDGGRLQQLRELGGEGRHARPARGFAADIDDNPAPVGDLRKVLYEALDVLRTKAAGAET